MTTPTFNELYTSIVTDLKNKLGITTLIGKTFLNGFALVQAAKLKLIYLTAAFLYKNVFVDTADPESLGGTLERFGLIKLGRLPNAATAGTYKISVTGTIGATIPAGTTFKSLDASTNPNHLFILDTDYTLSSTTDEIQVRALDIGSVARLEVGDGLQVTSPIANVSSFQTVNSVETTPTDAESYDDYREKTIEAYQVEPQGGARTDYRIWAADAAGVRKVYPYARDGYDGEINLYVEATVADSLDGHGTPTQSILDEVLEVIEYDPDETKTDAERGRRPLGTFQVHAIPVEPLPVDIEIVGLSDTSYIPAIQSAVVDLLYNIRPYIGGADNPTKVNIGKFYQSDIYAIVKDTLGSDAVFTSLTVKVNSILITLYEFEGGNIPYLNSLTTV